MSNNIKKSMSAIVILGTMTSVFWVLSTNNAFGFDDTSWMNYVMVNSYSDIFHVFPRSVYLDRPVGIVFIKMLYDLFGLDYGRHHAILYILHLINTWLVYALVKLVSSENNSDDKAFFMGTISAFVFGAWPLSHMAVQWDAAIFDLLGTTLALLGMLFYAKSRLEDRYVVQNAMFSYLFYFLSVRTKEMFVVLPAIYLVYELYRKLTKSCDKWYSSQLVVNWVICISILIKILMLRRTDSITTSSDSIYYYSLNIIDIFKNLWVYTKLFFDFSNPMLQKVLSIIVWCGGIISIPICLGKIYKFFMAYIFIGVSIVTVLPLVNQNSQLYLYFPAVFFGILFAMLFASIPDRYWVLTFVVFAFLMYYANNDGRVKDQRESWMASCSYEKKAWDDLREIEKPVEGSNVYVELDTESYSPFYYGNGNVCRVIFNDTKLNVILTNNIENEDIEAPYLLLKYADDHVTEIGRSEDD